MDLFVPLLSKDQWVKEMDAFLAQARQVPVANLEAWWSDSAPGSVAQKQFRKVFRKAYQAYIDTRQDPEEDRVASEITHPT